MSFEEYQNKPLPSKEIKKVLSHAVDTAYKDESPFLEEANENKKEYDALVAKWRKGNLTYEKFLKESSKLQITESFVQFETLPEFIQAVSYLPLPEDRKKYYLAHENEHMAKAEKHGVKGTYRLYFHKMKNGDWHITPSIGVGYPVNMCYEEYITIFKDIVGAPDELSPGDEAQLEDYK